MLTRVILASYARTNNPFWHSQDVQICPYFPFAFLSTWPRIRAKLRRCVRRWFSLFQVCPSTEHAQADASAYHSLLETATCSGARARHRRESSVWTLPRITCQRQLRFFPMEKHPRYPSVWSPFCWKIVWDQDSKIVWHLLWPLSTRSVMGEKFFGDFSPLVSLFGCMFVVCNVLFAAFWSWNLSVCCFNTVLPLEPAIWKAKIATCFSWNTLRCICIAFRKHNLFVGRIFFNCCAHDTRPKMFPW